MPENKGNERRVKKVLLQLIKKKQTVKHLIKHYSLSDELI